MAKTNQQTVSKTPTSKGLKIKCHGMYYYKTETVRGVKPFETEVRSPSLEFFREEAIKYAGTDDKGQPIMLRRSFINIRGILKKRLLPILLRRDFPDFARVRFVVIDEVISETGEELDLPITLRSKAQLAELIETQRIPIDVNQYVELDTLRTDIIEYQEDPETFLRNKPLNDKKRSEEQAFLEMNNLSEALPPRRPAIQKPTAPSTIGIQDL